MTIPILAGVFAVVGFLVGEVFDVWYDSTHAEGTVEHGVMFESVQTAPRRPLAFGYAKLWFREVIGTPDAFEHYHWGLWLAANAVTMYLSVPETAFVMLGIALSLIMDENRNGLADEPFGLGKPYFTTCTLIGVVLLFVLVLRTLISSSMLEVTVVTFAAPFAILFVLYVVRWLSS